MTVSMGNKEKQRWGEKDCQCQPWGTNNYFKKWHRTLVSRLFVTQRGEFHRDNRTYWAVQTNESSHTQDVTQSLLLLLMHMWIWTGELTIQGLYLPIPNFNINTYSGNIAAIIQWHSSSGWTDFFLLFTQITNNVPSHWFPSEEELHFLQNSERRRDLFLPAAFERGKNHIFTFTFLCPGIHENSYTLACFLDMPMWTNMHRSIHNGLSIWPFTFDLSPYWHMTCSTYQKRRKGRKAWAENLRKTD